MLYKENKQWLGLSTTAFSRIVCIEAHDGTLYLTDVPLGKKPMDKTGIAKSKLVNGRYQEPQLLQSDINTDFNEFHPFVYPDEGFLIFDSDRPGGFGGYDIYVVFKNREGNWDKAINFGSKINSDKYEGVTTVSLDGTYLFFNKDEDIYWVSAKIINKLKPGQVK